jgi:hypothetical protein
MSWTIDSALDDDSVDLVNRDEDLAIFEFRVGELETTMSRLWGALG